jgi:hypothetical protein
LALRPAASVEAAAALGSELVSGEAVDASRIAWACNFIRVPPREVGTAWQFSASREARMNNLLRRYT